MVGAADRARVVNGIGGKEAAVNNWVAGRGKMWEGSGGHLHNAAWACGQAFYCSRRVLRLPDCHAGGICESCDRWIHNMYTCRSPPESSSKS
jgi:hypothetical protein